MSVSFSGVSAILFPMASKKSGSSRRVPRSTKTGRFVKKVYARRHPNTTTTETVVSSVKKRVARVVRDKATGKFVSSAKLEDILDANDVMVQVVKR